MFIKSNQENLSCILRVLLDFRAMYSSHCCPSRCWWMLTRGIRRTCHCCIGLQSTIGERLLATSSNRYGAEAYFCCHSPLVCFWVNVGMRHILLGTGWVQPCWARSASRGRGQAASLSLDCGTMMLGAFSTLRVDCIPGISSILWQLTFVHGKRVLWCSWLKLIYWYTRMLHQSIECPLSTHKHDYFSFRRD